MATAKTATCDYQGHEFGASYPDSMCIDGRLWDADACDGRGNLYEPSEHIPCPKCQRQKAVEHLMLQLDDSLSYGERRLKARAIIRTRLRRFDALKPKVSRKDAE